MRRKLAIVATLMASLVLASCGEASTTATSASSNATTETSASTTEEKTEEAVSESSIEESTTETSEEEIVATTSATDTSAQSTVDDSNFDQVVVDDENIRFEITGIDHESIWGYSWNVNLQNKTDATLMFSMEDVAVNGVMCDPFWATTVTAGNQANDTIIWPSADLEDNNITEVSEVEFTLDVYDDDNWENEYLNQKFTIYPMGEEAAVNDSQEAAETDIVLFDTDQCSMRVTAAEPDNEWGYTLKATLVNKTSDKDMMFGMDNASMNGIMCDPFWADSVAAGKTSNVEITWMSETMSDAGIDPGQVTDIEFSINVMDDNSFEEVFPEQTFTLSADQLQSIGG